MEHKESIISTKKKKKKDPMEINKINAPNRKVKRGKKVTPFCLLSAKEDKRKRAGQKHEICNNIKIKELRPETLSGSVSMDETGVPVI